MRTQGSWVGGAAILPGVGVFKGHSGDNREHRHWAHQLSLGLERPIEVTSGQISHRARAVFIRAGAAHLLVAAPVLSVYLDPTTTLARALDQRLSDSASISALPPPLIELLRNSFGDTRDAAAGVSQFASGLGAAGLPVVDRRAQQVFAALAGDVHAPGETGRQRLAKLAGLSESRFSHWFREQTGMPLRSYRKWLRLVHGLEQVLGGHNLTVAAYEADFADQAHFSRTFVQMFGVKPSEAFAQITALKKT